MRISGAMEDKLEDDRLDVNDRVWSALSIKSKLVSVSEGGVSGGEEL